MPKKESVEKLRFTFQLREDVIEKARDAVYWTPGVTLASFAEEAFIRLIEQMEKQNGKPFPSRSAELKTGRPISGGADPFKRIKKRGGMR